MRHMRFVLLSVLAVILLITITGCPSSPSTGDNTNSSSSSSAAPKTAMPAFSPVAGTYTNGVSVVISCSTSNAVILWSTNGTIWNSGAAVAISNSMTLQARATNAGMDDSDTNSGVYSVFIPGMVSQPTFNFTTGSYNNFITIFINCATAGATVIWRTNGSAWTSGVTNFNLSTNTTFYAYATNYGMSNSTTNWADYSFQAGIPQFSSAPGTYTNSVTVTISSVTSNSSVIWDVNSAMYTRTNSTAVYTLSNNSILYAKASATGMTMSTATQGSYTIYVPCADWISAGTPAFDARYGHSALLYNNRMWVIGGYAAYNTNDVWYSADGTNWSYTTNNASFGKRYGHGSVVFNNAMWVIGGNYIGVIYTNDVWFSTNGTNWQAASHGTPFRGRFAHSTVVFNGMIWLIGGYVSGGFTNDVWYSANGTNWTCANSNAQFKERCSTAAVVYDNKIWLIGGQTVGGSSGNTNDVWYSSDGTNWTCATNAALFTARSKHTAVVFDNRMWVIGGVNNSSAALNDVYHSSDGITWTRATSYADFSARSSLVGMVFNSRIWIVGGSVNDVWYTDYSRP